ncbi:unnamed protein product [Closterium sp. Naga37s-1]|nr:unnamed protein product [Closterium sp. Naga37s-1]
MWTVSISRQDTHPQQLNICISLHSCSAPSLSLSSLSSLQPLHSPPLSHQQGADCEDLKTGQDVDCEDLKAGQLLNISIPASAQVCRVRYSVTQVRYMSPRRAQQQRAVIPSVLYLADAAARTCDPINDRFGIDVTTINPSLDCTSLVPNQQVRRVVGCGSSGVAGGEGDLTLVRPVLCQCRELICIQAGDAVSGAADYNLCTSYLPVNEWTTCANAVEWYGLSWFDLYHLHRRHAFGSGGVR